MPPMRERRSFEVRHTAVLPAEVLAALDPRRGQTVVDCTVGLGGHATLLLERITPGGQLIGLDFDPANLERARGKLSAVPGGRFALHQSNFAALPAVLGTVGVGAVDAILADLGVASPQIDDPARGFSYRQDGPLDMRMDPDRRETAAALLARIGEAELRDALLEYGDETDAPAIARLIVNTRGTSPITTTGQLAALVCQARDFTLQRAAGAKLHPAARTFQALRMMVNREAENLDRLLAVAPSLLRPGGRVVIISFHSGEDRRVKRSFRDFARSGVYEQSSSEPIVASEDERRTNPRARSAKVRWAQRAAGHD
jgi:16S rRNA (cytosine1402-N4)-methyltransferase